MQRKQPSGKARPPKKKEPTPAEIAPGVFVGGWNDAEAFEGARFCVLDEAPPDMPPATHIRIFDGAKQRADRSALDRLADAVGSAQRQGKPVLIFCGHGVMRSPLGGMWYLHRSKGITLDQAFEQVHARRSRVVHPKEWVKNAQDLVES